MCLKYPGMRALMVRKTAISLTSTALVTFREHVAKEAIDGGLMAWYGGSQQEAASYRYANGSIIAVGGMDKPTRIMSSEYDVAYVQEATELTVTDWESISTRLRNGRVPYQQIIADCNPDAPHHWLKVRCDDGKTRVLNSRHEDNPRLFNPDGSQTEYGANYIAKLDALTGVRYARLRKGEWVAAEGIIYEDFDSAKHLVDHFPIPADWPRYWSIDFGFVNPFVCQWWAEAPDGDLYLYREIYRTRRLVEDHAKDILACVTDSEGNWTEPRPRLIICDHDAEGRATLQRDLGMPTRAADKRVIDGIQATQARFKANRIKIMRDCTVSRDPELVRDAKPTCSAQEILSYVWDTKGVSDPKTQETPRKEDDHGMDAMRYLVINRDPRGRAKARFL
jgi:PBSX family phage terminase large subunit